jgi:hypothetical protein
MYYEDLLESAVNDESSVDYKLRLKQSADAVKKLDKYYEKYSVPFNKKWTDGKFYKRVTIENYGSGSLGSLVRNAVTGDKYNIVVGSADEDLLFKVIEASGRNGRKEPLMLYYDSPEQYENHQFVVISEDIKQKWSQKSLQARKRLGL